MSSTFGNPFSSIFSNIGSLGQQNQQTLPSAQPYTGSSTTPGTGPLPAIRSGSGLPEAGQSSIDPILRPYLGLGLQRAEQLFFGQPQPSLYPGQMYVSPSSQTLEALQRQEDIARQGAGVLAAGQQAYGQSLAGFGATAGGQFLGGNPYRDAMIASATRPLVQQYEQTVQPGIASQFSAAGRYGSGAMQQAQSSAAEGFARGLGDVASALTFQDYSAERGRQQQAMAAQAELAARAPSFYASQFLPSEQLAQIGASREAIEAKPLQEAISRYQFQQQLPYSQLQSFLSSVYGNPMAGSNMPQQAPAQPSRIGTALGGAALGAGVGSMFPSGAFGFSPGQTVAGGAALGGLLGGFF